MYIVEWCDHTGQLNQRAFDTKEDAELEAAYLETKFDYVAILWETEIPFRGSWEATIKTKWRFSYVHFQKIQDP